MCNSVSAHDATPVFMVQLQQSKIPAVATVKSAVDSISIQAQQDHATKAVVTPDSPATKGDSSAGINQDQSLPNSDSLQKGNKLLGIPAQMIPGSQKEPEQDTTSPKVKSISEIFSTSKIFFSLITFLAGWLILRYLTKLLNIFSDRWPQYRLTIKGLIPVIRIGSWTMILFFIIAAIIQPAIETIWTITASAGIAIGFASQDILKNIFGGVLILMDKPFKVGDKIQIDSYYGEVINIGLRTVRIVTPDDSIVSIPNSEIVNKSVSNANAGAPDCQVVAEFYFENDLDMAKAHTLAIRCASISRYVFLNKPITATFKNEIYEGRSMIKMRLKAYVFDHRYEYAFITDMSKIVFREFPRAGLKI